MNNFNLIMVGAYMEAGGNTLQRHLDGHPRLISNPFETQLGTKFSSNLLTQLYHFRYSWPVIPTDLVPDKVYSLMFDEEVKTYLRTRERSKFKNCGMIMNEENRLEKFARHAIESDTFPSRADYVRAYFQATADAWENRYVTSEQTHHVAYYPLSTMDADVIFKDFPDAHIIHITRNPWSSFSDTIKRPFPLSLEKYLSGWNIIQMHARIYSRKYPDNFHVIRFEDLVANKRSTLEPILDKIGVGWSDACSYPSWNAQKMESIFPWGTVKYPTTEANIATARELTAEQVEKIWMECQDTIDDWNYAGFHNLIK